MNVFYPFGIFFFPCCLDAEDLHNREFVLFPSQLLGFLETGVSASHPDLADESRK